MKRTIKSGIALTTIFMLLCGYALANERVLEKDDTIIFLGDSITQRGIKPGGYIALASQRITREYPNKNIKIIGAGIGGHRVPNCQERLDRDVLQKKPTIVVIYIGINDVWHWELNRGTKKDDFEAGLKDMISKINAIGARVILCTPTVIGEKTDGTNKFDKMLDEYSDISRKVAKQTSSQLLDLRVAFLDYLKEHNTGNLKKGILTGDAVHLNSKGNAFLSELMLDALNVSNEDPSRIGGWDPSQLEPRKKKTIACDVSRIIKGPEEYTATFTYEEGRSKLEIFGVSLYDGDTLLAEDIHEGETGTRSKNNSYVFSVEKAVKGPVILKALVSARGGDSTGSIRLIKGRLIGKK